MNERSSRRSACAIPRALELERKIRVLAWLPVAALVACDADRSFCSVAIYEAPRSEYRLAVAARGIIEANHDLAARSTSEVRVCSIAGNAQRHDIAWTPSDRRTRNLRDELARRLDTAGYRRLDEQELEDSAKVVAGILSGPKGTRLGGQTGSLKLVLYERCDADADNKRLAEQVRTCRAVLP